MGERLSRRRREGHGGHVPGQVERLDRRDPHSRALGVDQEQDRAVIGRGCHEEDIDVSAEGGVEAAVNRRVSNRAADHEIPVVLSRPGDGGHQVPTADRGQQSGRFVAVRGHDAQRTERTGHRDEGCRCDRSPEHLAGDRKVSPVAAGPTNVLAHRQASDAEVGEGRPERSLGRGLSHGRVEQLSGRPPLGQNSRQRLDESGLVIGVRDADLVQAHGFPPVI